MVDRRVGVEVLAALADEEPVERALGAFAVEGDTEIGPRERSAESDVNRREAAAARLPRGERVDVEGVGSLVLELRVLENRTVRQGDFRDGVR